MIEILHPEIRKVLLVDDDEHFLTLMTRFTKEFGFAFETAENGAEALERLKDGDFDIVISDYAMPVMDGMQLLLQATELYPSIDFIIVTGYKKDFCYTDVIQSGATDFIEKPFQKDELKAKLERIGRERKLIYSQQKEIADRKEAEAQLKRNYQTLSILNKLFHLFHEEVNIDSALERFIRYISSLPILDLEEQGALFLVDEGGENLVLHTHHHLNINLHSLCQTVPLGKCLCGRAAVEKKVVFANCLDHRHEIRFSDIVDHGHYCVPILSTTKELLGVFTVYTKVGKAYDSRVEEILSATATVLAGTLDRLKAQKESEQRQLQLIEADKMVSLGILVAGVAHEINNPNNFIMMNTPILEQTWESIRPILDTHFEEKGEFDLSGIPYSEMRENIPQLFDGIKEGGERIKKIVLNLKDYARKDSSDMSREISINEVLKAGLILLSSPIKKATHHLQVELSDDIPAVIGNFQRIEQVLINIIQNACQALPNPSKGVKISTHSRPTTKEVVVSIQDEGQGILPEHLVHIQDPFFTTKRDFGGTGLGLSISAGIMEELGGRLDFHSQPGQGTTVDVVFPVKL